jgi:hypothetical protein
MAKKPTTKSTQNAGKAPATVYLERELIEAIDRMGKESRRSLSQMLAVLIDRGMEAERELVAVK